MVKTRLAILSAAAVLLPGVAAAHTGHSEMATFSAGLAHPFSGLDHALTMLAVGVFAAHLGGRALVVLPAAFLALMAAGAGLGGAGLVLPLTEAAIALSLAVLGLAVLARPAVPLAAAGGLVGLVAVSHGQAHFLEMPAAASPATYGLGFLAATVGLLVAGLGTGVAAGRLGTGATALIRAGGGLAALAGLGALAGLA